jgi:hypothetical protein
VAVMFKRKYLFVQIRISVCFGYVGHSVMSRKSMIMTSFTCFVSDTGRCIMLHFIFLFLNFSQLWWLQ